MRALLLATSLAIAACGTLLDGSPEPEIASDGGATDASEAAVPEDAAVDSSTGGDASAFVGCRGEIACERFVFTTSGGWQGGLGFAPGSAVAGIERANARCREAAASSALQEIRDREFVAWISTNGNAVAARLVHGTQAYKRPDGVPVAADWSDLTSGDLQANMLRNEHGDVAPNEGAWTGSDAFGNATVDDCDAWTATSGAGTFGTAASTGLTWSQTGSTLCTQPLHLYCIER